MEEQESFKPRSCLTPKPGLFPLCFFGGGHSTLIQEVSIERHLYSSRGLGVVRDTAVNQTDAVPALMEPSQVHLQETLT